MRHPLTLGAAIATMLTITACAADTNTLADSDKFVIAQGCDGRVSFDLSPTTQWASFRVNLRRGWNVGDVISVQSGPPAGTQRVKEGSCRPNTDYPNLLECDIAFDEPIFDTDSTYVRDATLSVAFSNEFNSVEQVIASGKVTSNSTSFSLPCR